MQKAYGRFIPSVHFFAMIGLVGSMLYPLLWPFKMPTEFWIKNLIVHLLFGVLYVVNMLVFSPKLMTKARGVIYLATVCASIYLLVLVIGWIGQLLHVDEAMIKAFSTPGHPFMPVHHWDVKWVIFLAVIFLGLSNVYAVSKKLQTGQLAFEVSEKERISAELSFLKAQINPHFFFNTLHTIYSLTDTDPSAAKESLYTLSHMMRYVIYETKNDLTSLRKEINFIEDYIKLMKVRLPKNVQIIFEIQSAFRDLQVAPMLFLPFIENAFKHGIRVTQPSYVLIEVSEHEKVVRLEVKNSYFDDISQPLEESSGIGIANTRRRLDLIYPGKYELNVEKDEFSREHIVTLTLDTK